jgi:deoxyribonuclease V
VIVCLDVHYPSEQLAIAAGVALGSWDARSVEDVAVARVECPVSAYAPGDFYRRELPCLLAVLAEVPFEISVVVIDGYVFLDEAGRRGLGAHLSEALGGVPVVGVAKTRFRTATTAIEVLRGGSAKPLWVTAVGMEASVAADRVRAMVGDHRVPTHLRGVDRLCRTSLAARPWGAVVGG